MFNSNTHVESLATALFWALKLLKLSPGPRNALPNPQDPIQFSVCFVCLGWRYRVSGRSFPAVDLASPPIAKEGISLFRSLVVGLLSGLRVFSAAASATAECRRSCLDQISREQPERMFRLMTQVAGH